MPLLMNDSMEKINTASKYNFSAVKLDKLEATEYTLVTIVVDKSSSLSGYDRDLEKMIKSAVDSCKKSPRSENLLIRLVSFNQQENEEHGFKLLNTIDLVDYDNMINTSGSTLLYDSVYHAIEATQNYGKILFDQDYISNAIIFIITDGADNESTYGPVQIKTLVQDVRRSENLESVSVILVGMTGSSYVQQYLDEFKDKAELDEFVDMGEVTASKLAKLAGIISQSISSTSQALADGKSQSLSF